MAYESCLSQHMYPWNQFTSHRIFLSDVSNNRIVRKAGYFLWFSFFHISFALLFFFFCYSFSLTVSCYRHRLRTYLLSSALVCPVVPSHFIDCYNGSVWVCLLTFSGSLPLLIYIHIKCLSKWKPPELLQGLQGNMRATQLHATKLHVHLFDCSYLQTELN